MKQKIIILILIVLVNASLFAKKSAPTIKADDQQITENKLIASGNVEIAWEGYRIYADYLEFDQETKIIMAKGRVTMASRETVLTGDKLSFNLKEKTGEMYDSYGQLPPTIRYHTQKIKQVNDDTLKFDKLDFTSCTQCKPRWKITCSKGKIKKEKYIAMSHVLFKIKNIPIFYLPYLRYPVNKNGRSTGILFPKIGSNAMKGFFLSNSLYWAISENTDLTLNFDYFSKAGIGAAEEFRYLFDNTEGNVKFYFFKYKDSAILKPEDETPDDQSQFYTYNTSDYYLQMSHIQKINFLDTKIIVNIDKQSDASFLKLFSNDFYSVLRRISRSSVSMDSSFNNMRLSFKASQYDTFYTFNNKGTSVRYMPSISFYLKHQKIWKIPGYFSLDTSYAIINRVGKFFGEEETTYLSDVTSKRLNIHPTYTLNLLKLRWMRATLKYQWKNSFYPQSRDPDAETDEEEIVDEPLHLQYQTATLDMQGPTFSKIYEFRDFKLNHLIQPAINFRYVTKVEEEDRERLIPVDRFDHPSYSYVGASLTTRILYKHKNKRSARDIFSYTIKQSYYFDPLLAHRYRDIGGFYPEFSFLSQIVKLKPVKEFALDAKLSYSHQMNQFTKIRFGVSFKDKNGVFNSRFFYTTNINPYAAATYIFNRDSVGGNLNLNIRDFPIKVRADVNYDLTDAKFRYASFLMKYDYQCIQFKTELKLIDRGTEVDSQFNIGVSFGNMGMVKGMLGIEEN